MRMLILILLGAGGLMAQTPEVWEARGGAALSAYRYGEAVRYFYDCHRDHPTHLPCLEGLAGAQYQGGNFRDARIYYRQILSLDTTHRGALIHLALMDEREGRRQEASMGFERLRQLEPENPWFLKRYGQQRMALEDLAGATAAYRSALAQDPHDLETLELLGQVLFQTEQYEEALKLAAEGLSRNDQYRPLWRLQLRCYQKIKDHPGTLEAGKRLLALADSSLFTLSVSGYAALQCDSLDLALGLLGLACRQDRATELTHYHYSLALERSGDPLGALEQTRMAIRKGRSPFLWNFLDQEARMLEDQGKHREAIQALRSALDLADDPGMVFRVARLYDQWHKEKTAAVQWYERYLRSRDTRYAAYVQDRLRHIKQEQHQHVNK